MSDDIYRLSLNDFDRLEWRDVIQRSDAPTCGAYSRGFYRRSQELDEVGDAVGREAFVLLGNCAALMLKPGERKKPFEAVIAVRTRRSADLDNIRAEDVEVLRELTPTVTDPEFRARVADIVWLCRRDIQMAKLAIDAYLAAAKILDGQGDWLDARDRMERAFRLATQVGQGNPQYRNQVVTLIEQMLAAQDQDSRE